jgi:hypothetical protein
MNEALTKFIDKIAYSYFGTVKAVPKKVVLVIDGISIKKESLWQHMQKDVPFLKEANFYNTFRNAINLANESECGDHFNTTLWDLAIKANKANKVKGLDAPHIATSILGEQINVSNYIPVIDVETFEKSVLNKLTGYKSNLSSQWYESQFKGDDLTMQPYVNKIQVYDPSDLEPNKVVPYDNDSGDTVVRLNDYVPPKWRLEPVDPDAELPLEVSIIMEHLFPDPKALKYVWDWIHTAVFSRCETYLVLNSSKGIGKGVLAKMIEALIGRKHFVEAQRSFLDSQFNGLLKNKQFVYLDELEIKDKARVDKLKSYINQQQNIEEKHKEANKTVRVHASFLITNNAEGDMYIEDDDRRFSVVDATTKKLEEVMPNKQVQQFINIKLQDPEYVLQLGSWLTRRGVSEYHNAFSIYRGEKFEALVTTSMSYWKRFLVDLCEKRIQGELKDEFEYKPEGWSLKELGRLFKREHPELSMKGRTGVMDFLRNTRIKGKRIAKMVHIKSDWVLIPLLEEEDEDGDEIIEDTLGGL